MNPYEDITTEKATDEYKVALVNHNHGITYTPTAYKCSLAYMYITALIMLLLGVFTFSTAIYIYIINEYYITYGSELFLFVIGGCVLFSSIFLWISVCNYTKIYGKTILFVIALLSFMVFVISTFVVGYSSVYIHSNGLENITEVDKILNYTIYEAYEVCCKNTTIKELNDVCYDIMGENRTIITYECDSYQRFLNDFYDYMKSMFVWILGVGSVVSIFTFITGVASCCLMTAYKRIAYYKNSDVK